MSSISVVDIFESYEVAVRLLSKRRAQSINMIGSFIMAVMTIKVMSIP